MVIFEMLRASAQRVPDKTALLCDGEAISYKALEERALSLAHQFQRLGVKKGERVALLFPNGNEMAVAYFACAAIGAISVPLNNRLTAKDLIYMINDCATCLLIVGDPFCEISRQIRPHLSSVREFVYAGPERKEGAHCFADLIAEKQLRTAGSIPGIWPASMTRDTSLSWAG